MLDGYKILTVTHRKTPLQSIGRFVITNKDEAELRERLEHLKQSFGLDELFYTATCNRVVYCFYTKAPLNSSFTEAFFQAVNPELSAQAIRQHVLSIEGKDAAGHLFKMAASIDSLVVGEREILRQLREAYARCQSWGLTGDHIRILMDEAVVAAKEVYSTTRLGEKSVSVVSLAIKELLKTNLPKSARILMVGAGQTNMLVAKFLNKYGYHRVSVFNRTLENSQHLAAMLDGKAYTLSQLESFTEGFDCLIVCTGATRAIVNKELYAHILGNDNGRKVVIDLSVPNNVAKEVAEQFDVHYIEVECLRALAKENLSFREHEVKHVTALLEQRLAGFEMTARQRQVERALHKIPGEVKAVRQRAMNEVFNKEIETLDESTLSLLDRMMTYMEKKCTGIPMKVAKEALTLPL
jgi:glutamyl-tRNA reductase